MPGRHTLTRHFSFDPGKAARNLAKHGVSFDEAATTFDDPHGLEIYDKPHSTIEDRWIRLALSSSGVVLVTVYTLRQLSDRWTTRIISARRASRSEVQAYTDSRP